MSHVPPTPENAHIFADLAVEGALRFSGVKLDYSPESLKKVDEIIEDFRHEGQSAEKISGALFCFGCYVGEVFVKNARAVWKNANENSMKDFTSAPIVIELPNGIICNPIGKVSKQLVNGSVDSISGFYTITTQIKASNE